MSQDLNILNVLVGLILFVAIVALYTYLIMLIWNKVIIIKFPNSNIQKLDFWEALALSVFVSLLFSRSVVSSSCTIS